MTINVPSWENRGPQRWVASLFSLEARTWVPCILFLVRYDLHLLVFIQLLSLEYPPLTPTHELGKASPEAQRGSPTLHSWGEGSRSLQLLLNLGWYLWGSPSTWSFWKRTLEDAHQLGKNGSFPARQGKTFVQMVKSLVGVPCRFTRWKESSHHCLGSVISQSERGPLFPLATSARQSAVQQNLPSALLYQRATKR